MYKKFLFLFVFSVFSVFAFGQYNCGQLTYNLTNSELNSGSNIYDLLWSDLGESISGYVFGHSGAYTYEYAEKFSNSTEKVITEIDLGVCAANASSSNSYVVIKIWNDYGGIPGTCIFANAYQIASFANDVANGYSTTITIPPVLVNSTYYVGVQVFYDYPSDQFALYAAVRTNGSPASTAYIKTASGTAWRSFPELYSGFSASMLIGTRTCSVPIDCNFVVSKSPVVVGETVNFYNRSLGNPTNYLWVFDGATPNTSTSANPTSIQYNTVGSYDVSLEASSSSNGNNTLQKNAYVKVIATTPDVSSNCSSLYNMAANETPDIIEFDNQEGFLLGHNAWGDHEFAEKFFNNQHKYLTAINLGLATVVSGSNNSIVSFNVYDEVNGYPGNLIGTCTSSLSTAAANQNQVMMIQFPTPIEVTGNFFVSFEIFRQHYNDIFSVSSSTLRANESLPTTTYIRESTIYGNNWACANEYGYFLSMNMSATLCDLNANVANANFIASATSVCPNTSINFTSQCTGNVTSYLWNFGDGQTSTQQNPSHSYANAGQYTVTLTINNGASTETKTNYITVNSLPNITFTPANPNILCSGSVNVTANGANSYIWSNGLGNTANANISAQGNYTVTATTVNGCSASATVFVSQTNTPLSVSINPSSTTLTCAGNLVTLTASATGATAYQWNNGLTGSMIQTNVANTYIVTATDINGCFGTATATISPAISDANVSILQPTTTELTCAINSINLTANGNGSYAWSNGSSSANATIATAGAYSVTVTTANGCTASDQITITSNTVEPIVSFSYSATEINCATSFVTITVQPAGMNYLWEDGSANSTQTVMQGGSYTVTVINPENSCSSWATAVVNENQTPTTAILQLNPNGVSEISCSQETINISVIPTSNNGPFTYNWNYGLGNNQQVTVNSAANYSVTVTGANGCTTALTQSITENITQPIISISASADNFDCHTEEITLTANANGLLTWGSGLGSSANITIENPGTYTVTVVDEFGCSASNQIVIGNIPLPSISMSDIYACNEDKVFLPAPQGYSTYQWTYNGNTVTQAIEAGYYTIEVTDNNNCSNTDIIQVFFSTSPEILAINISDCSSETTADGTATITVNQNNVSYLWSNGATSQSVENLAVGTYSVTVINEYGCSVSAEINISAITTEISENSLNAISIYPNPNNGNFVIDIENIEEISSYQILDITGKVIFNKEKQEINKQENINLNLSSGTYFVKINTTNNQEIKKIVVMNE